MVTKEVKMDQVDKIERCYNHDNYKIKLRISKLCKHRFCGNLFTEVQQKLIKGITFCYLTHLGVTYLT